MAKRQPAGAGGLFRGPLIEADAINEKDTAVAAKLVIDKYGANLGLDLKQQTQQNQLQLAMVRPGGDPKFPIYNVDPKLVAGPMYDAAKATGRNGPARRHENRRSLDRCRRDGGRKKS